MVGRVQTGPHETNYPKGLDESQICYMEYSNFFYGLRIHFLFPENEWRSSRFLKGEFGLEQAWHGVCLTPLDSKSKKGITMKTMLLTFSVMLGLTVSTLMAAPNNHNVLLIVVDDLAPALNCFGTSAVKSPNIDKLAARGMRFERNYCQSPLCNPSRASMFTGKRPETIKVLSNSAYFRNTAGMASIKTIPQYFKQYGYYTAGVGKLMGEPGNPDYRSWTTLLNQSRYRTLIKADEYGDEKKEVKAIPDSAATVDNLVASEAVKFLEANKSRKFFLATGFRRPHQPWFVPKKYLDMYPISSIKLPANWRGSNQQTAKKWLAGYYASVSYVDAMIGQVLNKLYQTGLDKKTVVILVGDHGYLLGEHGLWTKMKLWEEDMIAPMIISYPGMPNRGARSRSLTELIDVYPTVAQLCGLPTPAGMEGSSLVPVLNNPSAKVKSAIFSSVSIGKSARTEKFRYVKYSSGQERLFDCVNDPAENRNLIGSSLRAHKDAVAHMKSVLSKGWKAAKLTSSTSTVSPEPAPAPQPVSNVPATPVNLRASAGSGSIQLLWSQGSGNTEVIDGHQIFRSLDGKTFKLHSSFQGVKTSFIDSKVVPGTWYSYRVKTYNDNVIPHWDDDIYSPASNTASATAK
jgi:iduronate 2-sulfatase